MRDCMDCLNSKKLPSGLYFCKKFKRNFFGFSWFAWGDTCLYGKWGPADNNPFGICLRVCDFHPENCGHCTEPLQCDEWRDFWELVERYAKTQCSFCGEISEIIDGGLACGGFV